MKIGTITFHWATNYGAVLQAYALQHYLKTNQYETEIINYIPLRIWLIQRIILIKNLSISEFIKEKRIGEFRKEYLDLSSDTFYTNSSLVKRCNDYDVYICGSDQIWNESFTLTAEGKPTLSYYLNFVKEEKNRISYATSFGTDKLSEKVIDLVKPELEKFQNISVRENSGRKIVQDIGLEAKIVVDPTLLLEKESYEKLIEKKSIKNRFQLFSYILHNNQITANAVNDYVFRTYFDKNVDKKYDKEPIGILEWLYNVKNAKFIITNSFHGAIFSIIFHTPFFVVPVENSGMNDRINTLLKAVNLSSRIVDKFDKDKIDKLFHEDIDWYAVDEKINAMRDSSINFLEGSFNNYYIEK